MRKDIEKIAVEGLKIVRKGIYLTGNFIWESMQSIPSITLYNRIYGDDGEPNETRLYSDSEAD